MNQARLVKIHERLDNDFDFFAEKAPLLIKDKDGNIRPLVKNRAQKHIEAELNKQLGEVGFVRALILKGRQQGSSTYIGGRFMHKAVRIPGTNVYILAHDLSTTSKLFNMAKMYHENMHPAIKPEVRASNKKELLFKDILSEYAVGTAGNKEGGRGGTVRLFHGSEVAFWVNTQEIKSGVLQSVPLSNGTEIIFESTANGMGNMFYDMCMDAMKGVGLYRLIFVPWFWQEEYWLEPPADFRHTEEELTLRDTYGLNPGQLFWRRMKIIELSENGKNGIFKFKQEYPNNANEAFQTSGDSLIDSEHIYRARKSNYVDSFAPVIFGVDPAGTGKDKAALVIRQGRQILYHKTWDEIGPMQLVGKLAILMNKYRPDKTFIDYGHGYAVADRLKELRFRGVEHIHFKETADEDDVYANRRAEMWYRVQDWFKGEVNMPDDDAFQADLQCMPEGEDTSDQRLKLVSKAKIKEKYKKSPDLGDALALTFARKVRRVTPGQQRQHMVTSVSGFKSKKSRHGRF